MPIRDSKCLLLVYLGALMVFRLLFGNTWQRLRLTFVVTMTALGPPSGPAPLLARQAQPILLLSLFLLSLLLLFSSLRRGRGRCGAAQEGATPIAVFHTSVCEPQAPLVCTPSRRLQVSIALMAVVHRCYEGGPLQLNGC